MIEIVIGIAGILVSIAGIYYSRKDTKVIVVHQDDRTRAEPAPARKPRGWARLLTGLGMLFFLAGFAVFAFEVVTTMMNFGSQFGRLQPGGSLPRLDLGSLQYLPLGFGLCVIGAVLSAIGKFFSRG